MSVLALRICTAVIRGTASGRQSAASGRPGRRTRWLAIVQEEVIVNAQRLFG